MVYEFAVYQSSLDGESFWVAESKVLNGCASQGDTAEEAIKELEYYESKLHLLETRRNGLKKPSALGRHFRPNVSEN